jgi:hypothetical protein
MTVLTSRMETKTPGPSTSTLAALLALLAAGNAELPGQTVLREWFGTSQGTASESDQFGTQFVGLEDVNGDGVPDVAVGAPGTHVGMMLDAGRLYVYSGLDGSTLFTMDGQAANATLGSHVARAGDVDRDGLGEVLVYTGIPNPSGPGFLAANHIVTGTSTILNTYMDHLYSACVGDVDHDGASDLLMVGFTPPNLPAGAGAVDLFSGLTGMLIYRFTGTFANQGLGPPFWVGDVDADGTPDLLLGQAWFDGVWVYSGRTGNLLVRVSTPPIATNTFGFSVAGVGDVNGDGYNDFAVGDQGPWPQMNYWRISVFGGPGGAHLFDLSNPPPQDRIGDSLGTAGDIDGDGHDDILTGGWTNGGRTIVFSGRTQQPLVFMTYGVTQSPYNSSGLGDVNDDDFPDFLAGPFSNPSPPRLSVRVYSGAPIGVTTRGVGCPDARGIVPRIGCSYRPSRGSGFAINLSRVRSQMPAFLALGLSATSMGATPLPLDLGPHGMPGCFLRVSPDCVVSMTTTGPAAKGRSSYALPIPNVPALAGANLFAQWIVFEPSGSPSLASTTRALSIVVQ